MKMLMRRSSWVAAGFLTLALAAIGPRFFSGKARADIPKPVPVEPQVLLAAPGKVEAQSEELRITSDIMGRLREVYVHEGDAVHQGELIAALENADYRARAQAAKAQASLSRGEAERRKALFERGLISREELEQSSADAEVAQAKYDEAAALLEKTYIRAPISGIILRRYVNPGEDVSPPSDRSSPAIVSMADLSSLQVRMEVDENDVGKIENGQKAYVTAGAYPGRHFTGHVIRVGQILGQKEIRTDEPTERLDAKILECLVRLDPGQSLPLGLRVDAFVLAKPS